jgi:hypothetical protein
MLSSTLHAPRSKLQGGGAKLNFSYDSIKDILTIEGVKYFGALFRTLALPDDGSLYRLIQNKDGVVGVERVEQPYEDKLNQAFDEEAGLEL